MSPVVGCGCMTLYYSKYRGSCKNNAHRGPRWYNQIIVFMLNMARKGRRGEPVMTISAYLAYPAGSGESLVSEGIVRIRRKEGRALKAGGAWVYDNEIETVSGSYENGDIVRVEDFDGYFLGYGFINERSSIRVRMLSRRERDVITPAFLTARVRAAWEYRKHVIDTSSCRVIFGEADFLPGLTVDKYEDVLVVESLALGIDRLKVLLLAALVQVLRVDGIRVRGIYERSDAKVREKEGLPRTKGFLSEEFDTNVPITENGVKYIVDVKDGQKTGFFLDQKLNRRSIWPICRGARVLDCFTHTGSFGLNAAAAGAASVTSIDASELAIEQAKVNAGLNGFIVDGDLPAMPANTEQREAGQAHIRYIVGDVFDFLPAQRRAGEQYDVVILDPPAFTKSRSSVKAASAGYREINREGMLLVRDGGFLVTCSCSHFMTADLFRQAIEQAAHDARRRLRQVEFRQQAPDHPILWANDTSYYLKFYIFQVTAEQ